MIHHQVHIQTHNFVNSAQYLTVVPFCWAENVKVTSPGAIISPRDKGSPSSSSADSITTAGMITEQSSSSAASVFPSASSSIPLSHISVALIMHPSSSYAHQHYRLFHYHIFHSTGWRYNTIFFIIPRHHHHRLFVTTCFSCG